MNCPHCKSSNIKKAGHLKSGVQRYYCKDCKHHFNPNTLPYKFEVITEKCKVCGGPLVKCGFNKNGSQRYKCKECGTKCTKGVTYTPHKQHGITCPRCKHTITKKSGFTDDGRQLYVCDSCKYKFTLNNKYTHISEENKKLIIFYGVHCKVSDKQLSQMIGCCEKTIRNIKRQYKETCKQNEIKQFSRSRKIK